MTARSRHVRIEVVLEGWTPRGVTVHLACAQSWVFNCLRKRGRVELNLDGVSIINLVTDPLADSGVDQTKVLEGVEVGDTHCGVVSVGTDTKTNGISRLLHEGHGILVDTQTSVTHDKSVGGGGLVVGETEVAGPVDFVSTVGTETFLVFGNIGKLVDLAGGRLGNGRPANNGLGFHGTNSDNSATSASRRSSERTIRTRVTGCENDRNGFGDLSSHKGHWCVVVALVRAQGQR